MEFLEKSTYTENEEQRVVLTEMFKSIKGDRPKVTSTQLKKLGLKRKEIVYAVD